MEEFHDGQTPHRGFYADPCIHYRIATRVDPPKAPKVLYETEANRRAQRWVGGHLAEWWHADLLDMGKGAQVDYAILPVTNEMVTARRELHDAGEGHARLPRDPIVYAKLKPGWLYGHAEIKDRRGKASGTPTAHDRFATLHMELAKRDELLAAQKLLGGYARFVVWYTDGIWWVDARDTVGLPLVPGGTRIEGRVDKRGRVIDDGDTMVDVPISMLHPLYERVG